MRPILKVALNYHSHFGLKGLPKIEIVNRCSIQIHSYSGQADKTDSNGRKVWSSYSPFVCEASFEPKVVLPSWIMSLEPTAKLVQGMSAFERSFIDGFSFTNFPEYNDSASEILEPAKKMFTYGGLHEFNSDHLMKSKGDKHLALGVSYPLKEQLLRYEEFAHKKNAISYSDYHLNSQYLMPHSLEFDGGVVPISTVYFEADPDLYWRRFLSSVVRVICDKRKLLFNLDTMTLDLFRMDKTYSNMSSAFTRLGGANRELTFTNQELAMALGNILVYCHTEFYANSDSEEPLKPVDISSLGLGLYHPRRFEGFDALLIKLLGIGKAENLYAHYLKYYSKQLAKRNCFPCYSQ
ncbi:hypothetical protein [Pelagibaculum spongiae]|uniref:Uncharacterized protein n=1 Tax=Pelagibaculum spongiae TaxID=2080658 RepID=A0A2V1GT89_9GAMM|nr:hypothetical protein [Pelagibaculum spongiae]PVZ68885.1 hypothetical protein DC094_11570 [Pelagibaculum spongiae]